MWLWIALLRTFKVYCMTKMQTPSCWCTLTSWAQCLISCKSWRTNLCMMCWSLHLTTWLWCSLSLSPSCWWLGTSACASLSDLCRAPFLAPRFLSRWFLLKSSSKSRSNSLASLNLVEGLKRKTLKKLVDTNRKNSQEEKGRGVRPREVIPKKEGERKSQVPEVQIGK